MLGVEGEGGPGAQLRRFWLSGEGGGVGRSFLPAEEGGSPLSDVAYSPGKHTCGPLQISGREKGGERGKTLF